MSCLLCVVIADAQQGWLVRNSRPGSDLGQIQFVSPTEGWIVARNGWLLHTTDFGAVWKVVVPCDTDPVEFAAYTVRSMSFISPTTGWVIGTLGNYSDPYGAVLYKTTNSGSSWSRQLLNTPLVGWWNEGFYIQFVDSMRGYADVGVNGGDYSIAEMIFTTDGGATWFESGEVGLLYFDDPHDGWIISGYEYPRFQHTIDGGDFWSTSFVDSSSGNIWALQFVDSMNGWVIGDSGKILHTTNGGTNWSRVTNTSNYSLHKAVFFLDAHVGWIGGRVNRDQGNAIILHTTDGGESWTIQDVPFQQDINSIYFVDANSGWIAGDYGALAKTTTGGATSVWESHDPFVPNRFILEQNYPNPFNPTTAVSFVIGSSSFVTLKVYDVLGREIATLVNEVRQPGEYTVRWNADGIASGVYFYHLQAGTFSDTKKMLILM